jgi:hypothetical protein
VNIFKAFAHIGALTDNAPGVVAPVGELSKLSLTFVKQNTLHVSIDYPEEVLVGFGYKVNDVITPVPDAVANSALKAVNWTYLQARLNAFTEVKDVFQQAFITAFGDTFDFIDSGRMVQFKTFWCPEYITIAPKGQSATDSWRIWFADDAFFNQFDEFEILPIVPLIPLDQFFNDYDAVKLLVDAINQSEVFERIATVRGAYPETYQRLDVFTWQDVNNKALKIDTNWISLVYGAAGNNLDAIKEAIRDYILLNSSHTRDEWAAIFPDLFTSTEFIMTPLWQNVAVPGGDRQISTFSGIAQHVPALALCYKTCKGVKYTNEHIAAVISSVPSQFRSLMLAVVGGPENRDAVNVLNQVFPDYMNVPTTHVDFGMMNEKTRVFINTVLDPMLMYAEELTLNSGVPAGFNRVVRDGIVYLAKSYNKFLYLVVTKYSVDQLTTV